MTQKQAVEAYFALEQLTKEKWDLKDAFGLWQMKKKLTEAYEFQCEREKALLDLYGATPGEGGRWTFASAEDRDAFQAEEDKLNAMDFPAAVRPLTVRPPQGMRIEPDTLGALEGVIVFDLEGVK